MSTPNGWPSQNNPGQSNPAQTNPAQTNPAQPPAQTFPGAPQAPSSASAHNPSGPAGYGAQPQQAPTGQQYGQPVPPRPAAAPADLSKILSLSGLIAAGVAVVLLIVGFILALAGLSSYSKSNAVGMIFLYFGIGLAVVGVGAYVAGAVQQLSAKLKKD